MKQQPESGARESFAPPMNFTHFEQLKRWMGLTLEAERSLCEVAVLMPPHAPIIVERFYNRVMAEPEARVVMGTGDRIDRLRPKLAEWLLDLFHGPYDEDYLLKRSTIGRTHVLVALPQQYMFAGMSVLRSELTRMIGASTLSSRAEKIEAMHHLLDLELAIMLDTYRDSYVQKIREADRLLVKQEMAEMKHMAHIGQLAASLAHEIKNPLAGMSGAVQVLSKEMDAGHPRHQIMKEILRQIDRLDNAVKDLLTYARPTPPRLLVHDVGGVIRRALTVLAEDPAVKAVTVVCAGFDSGIEALLDPAQFEHVVSNLVINAAQACNGSGQVTLSIGRQPDSVVVRIKDNGEGMPADTAERALEPFFTTKTRGTGLGLSICKRIIDEHRGTLIIESQPQHGTTVTLTLPAGKDTES